MIGWNISVYRQPDGGHSAATEKSPAGDRLAVWQTNEFGLDWLDELSAEGNAINLGGDGYANLYTATAEHLLPPIFQGPPHARESWQIGEGIVDPEVWVGKTMVDKVAARECRFEEWLLVVAWDES